MVQIYLRRNDEMMTRYPNRSGEDGLAAVKLDEKIVLSGPNELTLRSSRNVYRRRGSYDRIRFVVSSTKTKRSHFLFNGDLIICYLKRRLYQVSSAVFCLVDQHGGSPDLICRKRREHVFTCS